MGLGSEQGELSGLGVGGECEKKFLRSSLVKQEKPGLVVKIKKGQERSQNLGHRLEAGVRSGLERDGSGMRGLWVIPQWSRDVHSLPLLAPGRTGSGGQPGLMVGGWERHRRASAFSSPELHTLPVKWGTPAPGRQHEQQTLG